VQFTNKNESNIMQLQAKYLLLCLFVGLFASFNRCDGAAVVVGEGEGKKDCHNEIHSTTYVCVYVCAQCSEHSKYNCICGDKYGCIGIFKCHTRSYIESKKYLQVLKQ